MEINKKKRVLLEDEGLNWLQIWMTVSLLNIKDNKAVKKEFVFLANRLVFPNMVHSINILLYLVWILYEFF